MYSNYIFNLIYFYLFYGHFSLTKFIHKYLNINTYEYSFVFNSNNFNCFITMSGNGKLRKRACNELHPMVIHSIANGV